MSRRSIDHDRFLRTVQSLAQAEDLDRKDRLKKENKKPEEKKPTCFNCERRKGCKTIEGKMTYNGTYSIGGDSATSTCDKWMQRKDLVNDEKKIKSLLKQFKKLN